MTRLNEPRLAPRCFLRGFMHTAVDDDVMHPALLIIRNVT